MTEHSNQVYEPPMLKAEGSIAGLTQGSPSLSGSPETTQPECGPSLDGTVEC